MADKQGPPQPPALLQEETKQPRIPSDPKKVQKKSVLPVDDIQCDFLWCIVLEQELEFSTVGQSEIYKDLMTLLNSTTINKQQVRELAPQLILPPGTGLRGLLWKLHLEHIGNNATQWMEEMENRKKEYENFQESCKSVLAIPLNELTTTYEISPIATDLKSIYYTIACDVIRTPAGISLANSYSKANPSETYTTVIARMLLIFVYVNPMRYIQGMNDLITVLYLTLTQEAIRGHEQYIESSCFFCFVDIMAWLDNHYDLCGPHHFSKMSNLIARTKDILRRYQPALYRVLEDNHVDYMLFIFQWVMLLFAREYTLPDVQSLWDLFLADLTNLQILPYFIVVLMQTVEKQVVKSSFSDQIHALQQASQHISASQLKQRALKLCRKDRKHRTH